MLGRRCFYRPWLVTLLRRKGGELAYGGVGGGLPGFVPFIRGRRRPKRPLISLISSSPLFPLQSFFYIPDFPTGVGKKRGKERGREKLNGRWNGATLTKPTKKGKSIAPPLIFPPQKGRRKKFKSSSHEKIRIKISRGEIGYRAFLLRPHRRRQKERRSGSSRLW